MVDVREGIEDASNEEAKPGIEMIERTVLVYDVHLLPDSTDKSLYKLAYWLNNHPTILYSLRTSSGNQPPWILCSKLKSGEDGYNHPYTLSENARDVCLMALNSTPAIACIGIIGKHASHILPPYTLR